MTPTERDIDELLEDFKRGVISAHNNNYGENVWNAEDFAQAQAKQAIIKLIEDEVREAVWKEKERIYEFATRKQANGLYVPIELGIEPWLREQL